MAASERGRFRVVKGYPEAEAVTARFGDIIRFDEQADWPESPADGGKYTHSNAEKSLRKAGAKL